ncbi:MAG TPA: SHOCT domain-containing protein [Thermoleophilaceae bacterium]|nr:SHOCT domain-containing protein [Thermoleophilaceae bacterium]
MTRVNPVGWFIVAFFLIGGIAFTIALPWVGIGQIWIGVAVLVGIIYLLIGRRASRMEGLRQSGLPGTAQVLEMSQTGVYVNENPQVKMKLQVQAQGLAPYQVEKKATVPMIAIGMLGTGRPLTVYVNPQDHEDIFIDWSGQGGGPMVAAGGGMGGPLVSAGSMPFTFAFPDGSSVDLTSDAAAQQEILDVLRAKGYDPHQGTLDLRSNPDARAAVLDVIARRGYRVPESARQGAAPAAAGVPAAAVPDPTDTRPGVDRLMELQQMKDKGLISDEDFEETKERILKTL